MYLYLKENLSEIHVSKFQIYSHRLSLLTLRTIVREEFMVGIETAMLW